MVEQLLHLEQYYHRLIMESLERVNLVAQDLWKQMNSVLHLLSMNMTLFGNKLSTSLLVYVVDLSAVPAIAAVIADEDAFPIHKLSTSLLVYVVDLSAVLASADVQSDEDGFPVNMLSTSLSVYVVDLSAGPAIAAGLSDEDIVLIITD